jgi:hypothetical protein
MCEDVPGLSDGRNPGLHGYRAWSHCGWGPNDASSRSLDSTTGLFESSGDKRSRGPTIEASMSSISLAGPNEP